MDPALSTALLNFGAMGVLAAVLLYLQQQARKDLLALADAFRAELKAERDMCHEEHELHSAEHERILLAIAGLPQKGRE